MSDDSRLSIEGQDESMGYRTANASLSICEVTR